MKTGFIINSWLALVIGNSRLHWAWWENNVLQATWDTNHLVTEIDSLASLSQILPQQYQNIANIEALKIYLASVVPAQTALWLNYPQIEQITIKKIPLLNTYTTLGIDRALAVYGAGETYHYPCLVIDSGTALTFTGVDSQKTLIGGAILAGLRSQFRGLHQQTAALPEVNLPHSLPPRWALDTDNAIASGITYTLIAGISSYINDWLTQFPKSKIILTGGDSNLILQYLSQLTPAIAHQIIVDSKLVFWGMRSLVAIKINQ